MIEKLVTLLSMLASVSQKEIAWLLKEKYDESETPAFHADLKRLESGEPLAYVIGWVDFLGCRIDLSAHPLIPRPETEFWVEGIIKEVAAQKTIKILDLFAGSGCIGIALLKHLPNATVDFGEKDPALCEQIKKNISLNNIDATHTRVIATDVFSNIHETYDLIVANPPYVDPTKKETVAESVLRHEPHAALFADGGGLAFIQKLLENGPAHLKQGGTMYCEFGENQKEDIALLTKNTSWRVEFQRDQFDRWRGVKLTLC